MALAGSARDLRDRGNDEGRQQGRCAARRVQGGEVPLDSVTSEQPGEVRGAVATMWAAALLLFVFGLYPLANTLTGGQAVPWYRHALTYWIFGGGLLLVVVALFARTSARSLEIVWQRAAGAAMRTS